MEDISERRRSSLKNKIETYSFEKISHNEDLITEKNLAPKSGISNEKARNISLFIDYAVLLFPINPGHKSITQSKNCT